MTRIAQILELLKDLMPWLLAAFGTAAAAILKLRNDSLQRAHAELADKVASLSNDELKEDISETVTRVKNYDRLRVEAEANLPATDVPPADSKPRK